MKKTPKNRRSHSGTGGQFGTRAAQWPARAAAELFDPATLQGAPRHLAAEAKKQWKCYRKELKRCQKKFSAKAVHQFRIETRRLLSLIELLAAFLPDDRVSRIRGCLKRHLDTFDDLRDTHVQLLLTRKLGDGFPEGKAFEEYLRKREKRVHRQTLKKVKRVKTKRLGKWITACRKDLKKRIDALAHAARPDSRTSMHNGSAASLEPGSPGELLLRSVDTAFQKTLELRGRIDPTNTATIHCTRVAFKKFRYMAEVLSGFLPVASPRELAAMHDYQTLMGDVQDMQVLIQAFEKFVRKRQPGEITLDLSADGGTGRGRQKGFRAELFRRRQQLIEHYLARAGQLDHFWPPARPKGRT